MKVGTRKSDKEKRVTEGVGMLKCDITKGQPSTVQFVG